VTPNRYPGHQYPCRPKWNSNTTAMSSQRMSTSNGKVNAERDMLTITNELDCGYEQLRK